TAPAVTVTIIGGNKNTSKYRVAATDAGGIVSVKVWFAGALIASSTTVPVEFTIAVKPLKTGSYPLSITVTDRAGNATTVDQTVTK
nr:hypothetical protein [Acidobacteriota bacterium]